MNPKQRIQQILIIGAASQLSKEVIKSCSDTESYKFFLGYFSSKKAMQIAISFTLLKANQFHMKHIDCRSKISIDNFFETVSKKCKYIDHLIYLSGQTQERETTCNLSWEEMDEMIKINLLGAMYIAKKTLKLMKRENCINTKSMTFVTSEAGRFGGNGISVYAATKGGLNSFVLGAAREFGPHNIRVNAVSPGMIETTMNKPKVETKGYCIDRELEHIAPLGRLTKYSDVAKVVKWIISEDSNQISGAIIPVSGGR